GGAPEDRGLPVYDAGAAPRARARGSRGRGPVLRDGRSSRADRGGASRKGPRARVPQAHLANAGPPLPDRQSLGGPGAGRRDAAARIGGVQPRAGPKTRAHRAEPVRSRGEGAVDRGRAALSDGGRDVERFRFRSLGRGNAGTKRVDLEYADGGVGGKSAGGESQRRFRRGGQGVTP